MTVRRIFSATTVALTVLSSCKDPGASPPLLEPEVEALTAASKTTCTGLPSGTTSLVVIPANNPTIAIGGTLDFNVSNQNGTTVPDCAVAWSVSDLTIASISTVGVAVGKKAGGPITVRAQASGSKTIRGTAFLTVGMVPVGTVTVTPASGSVTVGSTLQLTAVVKDGVGNVLTDRSVTWSSSATTNATVSSSGLVTGVAAATLVTITATAGGVSGVSTVAVTNPVPNGEIIYQRNSGNAYLDELWVVRPDGTGDTKLTSNSNIDQRPMFSPDGTRIAYSSDVGKPLANDGIWVMNRDGSNPVALTPEYAGLSTGPAWSPDGQKIAFYSMLNTVDGQWSSIVVMNADGSSKRILNAGEARSWGNPAWSRDGTKLYFYIYDGQFDLYSMNADGSNVTRITNTSTTEIIEAGAVSPDGTKLLYTFWGADNNREIYVMNIDGTGQTRLTNQAGDDQMPCWSPDGKRIAFASTRSGTSQIWIMNADGTNPVRLNSGTESAYYPYWR